MITDEQISDIIKRIRISDVIYRTIVEKKLDGLNFNHDKFDIEEFRRWLKEVGIGWISVNEKSPEGRGILLGQTKMGDDCVSNEDGFFFKQDCDANWELVPDKEIEYWALFPEPPNK